MPSVLYNIGVNVNKSQVIEHLSCNDETSLRVLVIPGLQVLLGVAAYIIKQVKHFILLILVIIGIKSEFTLDLKFLVKES
jgi:hypothetical protein